MLSPPFWVWWLAAGTNAVCAIIVVGLGCLFWLVGHRRVRQIKELEPPHLPVMPPSVAFVLPVKGTHQNSTANWVAQVHGHGYPGACEFIFVVAEQEDDAAQLLDKLRKDGSLHSNLRVIVAGHAARTSQKLHQQLAGIRAASSEMVLLLDDDMLLHPGAVGWLAQALREDPSALAASGFSFDVPASKTLFSRVGCMPAIWRPIFL